jgi:hypothetical protein
VQRFPENGLPESESAKVKSLRASVFERADDAGAEGVAGDE